MVNWILNRKALETFQTYSWDDIWVMVDCLWLVLAVITEEFKMTTWHLEFLINARSKDASALCFIFLKVYI